MDIEIEELRAFVAWCRTGSARAASVVVDEPPASTAVAIDRARRWVGRAGFETLPALGRLVALLDWAERHLRTAVPPPADGLDPPRPRLSELRLLAPVVDAAARCARPRWGQDTVELDLTAVRRVEHRLGLPLVTGVGRALRPEPAAVALVGALREVESRLLAFRTAYGPPGGSGQIAIGLPATPAPLLEALASSLPDTRLHVLLRNPRQALDDLHAGHLDVAQISGYRRRDRSFHTSDRSLLIGSSPVRVLLSGENPLARSVVVDPQTLSSRTWLVRTHERSDAELLWFKLGIRPSACRTVLDRAALVEQLVEGRAVAFAAATMSAPPGVVERPLDAPLRIADLLVWKKLALDTTAERIFAVARAHYADRYRRLRLPA